jgi:hypothetical protein
MIVPESTVTAAQLRERAEREAQAQRRTGWRWLVWLRL